MDDMGERTDRVGHDDAPSGDLLVEDPVLADFLDLLREAGRGPAPEVSVALTAVLHAADGATTSPRRRRLGRRGVAGVAVVGCMAAGVGAAAADGLPDPVRQVVSTVLGRWSGTGTGTPLAPTGPAAPPPTVAADPTVAPSTEVAPGPGTSDAGVGPGPEARDEGATRDDDGAAEPDDDTREARSDDGGTDGRDRGDDGTTEVRDRDGGTEDGDDATGTADGAGDDATSGGTTRDDGDGTDEDHASDEPDDPTDGGQDGEDAESVHGGD